MITRHPHVLLTLAEVKEAVDDLCREPLITIDVETTMARPRSNALLWVGLGAAGRSYLIPCGHPKGVLLSPEHKEKTAAYLLYPPPDPRGMTKLGKPSNAMKEHTVPARYAPPPKQLYPNEVCAAIKPLLWSSAGKIGHNLKFDLMSLAKYYGHEIPPGPYHDTIILRHVLDESYESYKLKDLTYEWLQIGVHKDKNGDTYVNYKEREKYYPNLGEKGVENFSLDEVTRYLAKDIRFCWMMFQAFSRDLDRKGVRRAYDFEMSLYPVIMGMEYEGFPVDVTVMDEVRQWLAGEQNRVKQAVFAITGGTFDLNHPASKRWVLYGKGQRVGNNPDGTPRYEQEEVRGKENQPLKSLDLKIISRTKKQRQPQVTQAVLEEMADKGIEIASLFLEWSGLEKLRGTFIEGLAGYLRYSDNGDLPTIHTSFRQHGTVTGRLSAAEPNPQQLPRGDRIRQLFVAGKGYVLIVADYDQIELRGAAFLSGDPVMYEVFEHGGDIHRRAASVMFNVDPALVTSLQRSVGKTQNFGTLYGAGVPKIAAVAGVSLRKAEQFIANYFQEFAYLEPWKAEVLREARARGDRTTPLSRPPYVLIEPSGRRRRLPELFSLDDWVRWHAERQAVNAVVQGLASNITKMAMLELKAKLTPYPAYMVMQVHDEIVIRVREDACEEVLGVTKRVMEDVRHPDTGAPILGEIPLVVSAASGPSWAAAKG